MPARRGVEGPDSLVVAMHWPVRANPRVALDLQHTGYGCRIDRACPFVATIEERTEHERLHERVARPEPVI